MTQVIGASAESSGPAAVTHGKAKKGKGAKDVFAALFASRLAHAPQAATGDSHPTNKSKARTAPVEGHQDTAVTKRGRSVSQHGQQPAPTHTADKTAAADTFAVLAGVNLPAPAAPAKVKPAPAGTPAPAAGSALPAAPSSTSAKPAAAAVHAAAPTPARAEGPKPPVAAVNAALAPAASAPAETPARAQHVRPRPDTRTSDTTATAPPAAAPAAAADPPVRPQDQPRSVRSDSAGAPLTAGLDAMSASKPAAGFSLLIDPQPSSARPREILQQATLLLERTAKAGESRASLVLHPEHLGQIEVQLRHEAGALHAVVTADNAEASRMLSEQLAQLERALEQSGVQVGGLEVRTSDRSPHQQQREQLAQFARGQQRSLHDVALTDEETQPASQLRPVRLGGGLTIDALA